MVLLVACGPISYQVCNINEIFIDKIDYRIDHKIDLQKEVRNEYEIIENRKGRNQLKDLRVDGVSINMTLQIVFRDLD